MKISGKMILLLPAQTGEGRNGVWKKQNFVIETEDQYPKKVCFSLWGDKFNVESFAIGSTVSVDFDVESREYNGRWYTDLKAWNIEGQENAAPAGSPMPDFNDMPLEPAQQDDLPF